MRYHIDSNIWEGIVPDVLIRNVPEATLAALKQRAGLGRRSLQQELLGLLQTAADEEASPTPAEIAALIRARLAASDRTFSDSTQIVREDRER
jgi:plasmid stability protein